MFKYFFNVAPHVLSYLNISIGEICASVIHFASQKRLNFFRCWSLLENRFVTDGNVFDTWETIFKFVFFLNVVLEVPYPSCWIEVSRMDGLRVGHLPIPDTSNFEPSHCTSVHTLDTFKNMCIILSFRKPKSSMSFNWHDIWINN